MIDSRQGLVCCGLVGLTSLTFVSVTFESAPASIELKQATLISLRLMARIVDIQVRAGDAVTKGRLLFRLEKTNLRASEHQAKGQAKAEVRIQEAAQNLGRICQLHERGLIAVADLDIAHGNRIVLQGELA